MMTFSKAGVAAALMAAFAYLPLHANAALFDDDEARKAIPAAQRLRPTTRCR